MDFRTGSLGTGQAEDGKARRRDSRHTRRASARLLPYPKREYLRLLECKRRVYAATRVRCWQCDLATIRNAGDLAAPLNLTGTLVMFGSSYRVTLYECPPLGRPQRAALRCPAREPAATLWATCLCPNNPPGCELTNSPTKLSYIENGVWVGLRRCFTSPTAFNDVRFILRAWAMGLGFSGIAGS